MKRIVVAALGLAGLASAGWATAAQAETAIFAGGCFWCVESDFDKVPGVSETVSGYIGGSNDNPTYRNHSAYDHREAVKIEFDPGKVSYKQLADIFFRSVDPTDDGGQFCDRGFSYTTAIYTTSDTQMKEAEAAKTAASKALGKPVVTPIEAAPTFWPAEDYHQNYYRSEDTILSRFGLVTKAEAYKGYREGCGRDARIRAVWGDQAHAGIPSH